MLALGSLGTCHSNLRGHEFESISVDHDTGNILKLSIIRHDKVSKALGWSEH